MLRPSGESANSSGTDVDGALISRRISGASATAFSRKCATAIDANAIAGTDATIHDTHGFRASTTAGGVAPGGALDASSISIRASLALFKLRLRSFCRQRRSK